MLVLEALPTGSQTAFGMAGQTTLGNCPPNDPMWQGLLTEVDRGASLFKSGRLHAQALSIIPIGSTKHCSDSTAPARRPDGHIVLTLCPWWQPVIQAMGRLPMLDLKDLQDLKSLQA